jgi:hypothetical protein
MKLRNVAVVPMLIVIALLAVYSPLHGGSAGPEAPAPLASIEFFDEYESLVMGSVSCQGMVDSGLPLPCPCDEIAALGCSPDRLPQPALTSVDPLSTAIRQFLLVGSIHTLFDPDLHSPPPQSIS